MQETELTMSRVGGREGNAAKSDAQAKSEA